MSIKLIACHSLKPQITCLSARMQENLDITWISSSLHTNPDLLRSELQAEIDRCDQKNYAVIVLGYGLCNGALEGITSVHTPLVIPRVYDCAGILLGSHNRYRSLYNQYDGRIEFCFNEEEILVPDSTCLAYIVSTELPIKDNSSSRRQMAIDREMDFLSLEEDDRLVYQMLKGDFNHDDFLILCPNNTLVPSYDHMVIMAKSR